VFFFQHAELLIVSGGDHALMPASDETRTIKFYGDPFDVMGQPAFIDVTNAHFTAFAKVNLLQWGSRDQVA
jgi:hypothetical protein